MGPLEAAYAISKYLKTAHTVIPMHFLTFPLLKGTVEEFNAELEKRGVTGKRVVDSYKEALGKWIDLTPTA
jgi:L-ascorbate metabolism protein UlaG (beta-lactamase superfamily)